MQRHSLWYFCSCTAWEGPRDRLCDLAIASRVRQLLISLVPGCRSLDNRRAIINEAALVKSITDAWDVDVVSTSFHMPLRDAISTMADTDILLGMHGAGTVPDSGQASVEGTGDAKCL